MDKNKRKKIISNLIQILKFTMFSISAGLIQFGSFALFNEVLHMTACKAAIKAGQLLNMRQMRQLIIDLCNTEHPFTCPHGRPCMIEITTDELYKMFKRTGF